MFTNDGQCASELAIKDFEAEKAVFDAAILSADYNVITSIVWSFPGEANFAMTGTEVPNYDFCGNKIQDLSDREISLAHIYYNVFPEGGRMAAIISWLRQYDGLFTSLRKRLEECSDVEKKNFINNTIPTVSENLVVRPSSWDNLPQSEKDNFGFTLWGGNDIFFEAGDDKFRFDDPGFDLFML